MQPASRQESCVYVIVMGRVGEELVSWTTKLVGAANVVGAGGGGRPHVVGHQCLGCARVHDGASVDAPGVERPAEGVITRTVGAEDEPRVAGSDHTDVDAEVLGQRQECSKHAGLHLTG